MFGKHQPSAVRLLKTFSPEMPTLTPTNEAKIQAWRLDALSERIKNKRDYESIKEVAARIKSTPPPRGLISAFFMGMREQPEFGLSHTRRLAGEMDDLGQALFSQQWPDLPSSLEGYKQTLIDSPLVRRDFWMDPINNHDWLPHFEQATSWQVVWKLTNIINFYLKISLLACWDVEYCADTFRRFTTIPLFLNLAPRHRPRPDDQPPHDLQRLNLKMANVVDGPMSQLIDLLWCLLRFMQDGGWPKGFPTLGEMAKDLNSYRDDLGQLRAGRPNLTIDLFHTLWPNTLCNKVGEPLAPPDTLLAAAHFWELIDPSDRADRQIIPVDRCYMLAWHRCQHELRTRKPRELPPAVAWPCYLNRGLEARTAE